MSRNFRNFRHMFYESTVVHMAIPSLPQIVKCLNVSSKHIHLDLFAYYNGHFSVLVLNRLLPNESERWVKMYNFPALCIMSINSSTSWNVWTTPLLQRMRIVILNYAIRLTPRKKIWTRTPLLGVPWRAVEVNADKNSLLFGQMKNENETIPFSYTANSRKHDLLLV
jgi:hypothetical protein